MTRHAAVAVCTLLAVVGAALVIRGAT